MPDPPKGITEDGEHVIMIFDDEDSRHASKTALAAA
jgi:hypothetical protein